MITARNFVSWHLSLSSFVINLLEFSLPQSNTFLIKFKEDREVAEVAFLLQESFRLGLSISSSFLFTFTEKTFLFLVTSTASLEAVV